MHVKTEKRKLRFILHSFVGCSQYLIVEIDYHLMMQSSVIFLLFDLQGRFHVWKKRKRYITRENTSNFQVVTSSQVI